MALRAVILMLVIGGCGGGGGAGESSRPLPAVCGTAFEDAGRSRGALAAGVVATEPVALSSCPRGASGAVQIGGPGGCGPHVVVDRDFTGAGGFGRITIHSGGKLVFPLLGDRDPRTPRTLEMDTTGIEILDGGLFSIGTAECPVGFYPGAHATVRFTGARDPACDPSRGCDDGAVKGIEVRNGGTLRLYGAKGVPEPASAAAGAGGVSWTVLSETAEPRGRTLRLAADVTQGQRPWEDGDWIVVGTSSFSPFESEFVRIDGAPTRDGAGGSVVRIAQPLEYAHFGSDPPTPSQQCSVEGRMRAVACGSVAGCTAPCTSAPSALNFNDPEASNFGIDERAEVGLISRSITLTATTPAPPPADREPLDPDPSLHWGGEIRVSGIHAGDPGAPVPPDVHIVGVEMEKFGKDQLGSYPLHIHMVGDAQQVPTLRANSIHHSFNKCITVHMSSNLTIRDMVCARIVGHMFYQEHGSEERVTYRDNLGLGAMSNSFDINPVRTTPPDAMTIARSALIRDHWWTGDHLAARSGYHYDGFNIPNTDDQRNPTRGSCLLPDDTGGFGPSRPPYSGPGARPCHGRELYTEPASGFWITNPSTELIGNAIGGCQGVGRAFWWVPPKLPIAVNGRMEDLKFKPLGRFANNRGHACYAGFYGEEEYSVASEVMVPHTDGTATGQPIIARLDGMTATRNRFRGVWLRPTWFVVQDGRFATNRENVSLVTSGGIDGNAPGVWALLADSVVAGISANNVGRFGPCPTDNALGILTGGQFGCIDHTPPARTCVEGPHTGRQCAQPGDCCANPGECPNACPARVCVSGPNAGRACTAPADCCADPAQCPDACPSRAHSADEVGLGYPPPSWNMFGYMLYDGPVRLVDVRFVNFRQDVTSLLTDADNDFLRQYSATHIAPTGKKCVGGPKRDQQCNLDSDCPDSTCPEARFVYAGDAALGWFQSNQSSYPTGTATRRLSWVNTDLRHQIYTERVGVNLQFNDGDKNTAVIDEDGTLTGFGVGDPRHGLANPDGVKPISLNNLPFNAVSNAVDECFSRGPQNERFEGRDTSLISPGSLGTLEFSSLYPWNDHNGTVPFPGPNGDVSHTQFLTFTRDDPQLDGNGQPRRDADGHVIHSAMTLHSRDGRGIWEPKVTSGFGYTVAAAPAPDFPSSTGRAGFAHVLDVGVADVVKPNISADNPFFVRLGICYTNADGSHPQDPSRFSITRGYKSYTGGFVDPNDPALRQYWSPSSCNNLDSLNTDNLTAPTCPAPRPRHQPVPPSGVCPPGSTRSEDQASCVFPTDALDRVDSVEQMHNADGTPNLETFTYDKDTGMLFLWVAQDEPNPVAPSPLGSCTGDEHTDDPACPDVADGETYYACPVKGCHVYLVRLDDPGYVPGASRCQPYERYTAAPFEPPNQLVLVGTGTVVQPVQMVDKIGDPFAAPSAATDPMCELTTSPSPPAALPATTAPPPASAADGDGGGGSRSGEHPPDATAASLAGRDAAPGLPPSEHLDPGAMQPAPTPTFTPERPPAAAR